jgi:hypothetical protein
MANNDAQLVRSITGRQTTAGAAEETMLLTLDGATPAASIAIPTNTRLFISDVMPGANAIAHYRLQQTNDGINFFDIALFEVVSASSTSATRNYTYNTGLLVQGGASVAVRVRVTTPGGAVLSYCTLRAYTES